MDTELNNLVEWLENNKLKISSYVPKNPIDHPVLSKTEIIDKIISSVKEGNLNAIELACDLTIQNKHIPFGKIIKSNIFEALIKQEKYINAGYREKLANLAVQYLNDPYPAKETKSLCRLLRHFETKYSKHVIEKVHNRTNETERWIEYLGK